MSIKKKEGNAVESKKMKQISLSAGDVQKEIKEIDKMQSSTPLVLSIVTNTCTGITSVVCC